MNLPIKLATITVRKRAGTRSGWEVCLPIDWRTPFEAVECFLPNYQTDADPPHVALMPSEPGLTAVAGTKRRACKVSMPPKSGPRLRFLYSKAMSELLWEAGLKDRTAANMNWPLPMLAMIYREGILILSAPTTSEGVDIEASFNKNQQESLEEMYAASDEGVTPTED